MSFAYIVYVKSIKRDLQKLPETAIETYKNRRRRIPTYLSLRLF